MYSLDTINDAIADKKQISFIYNYMGTDFKLHPKREEPYIVNPYQIVANNGRFYLIANYDKYDNVAHFRIDRMTDVKMLSNKTKPMKQVKGLENGLNLPKHMAEHIYMFSGESEIVKIKTTADMMSELTDWFGNDFSVMKKDGDEIVARIKCNLNAMRYWALQYGPWVEVIEPKSLRNTIAKDITSMSEKYGSVNNRRDQL